jgi:hypothetical protein
MSSCRSGCNAWRKHFPQLSRRASLYHMTDEELDRVAEAWEKGWVEAHRLWASMSRSCSSVRMARRERQRSGHQVCLADPRPFRLHRPIRLRSGHVPPRKGDATIRDLLKLERITLSRTVTRP